jgi:Protein of unknown function (DUF2721)
MAIMSEATAPTTAISIISAMVTPALLIVGSASLVATVLVRMARVVDRARSLALIAHEGSWEQHGVTADVLRSWLDRHRTRARYTERSIALLYAAVVVFVATALSIALDRSTGNALEWLPVFLAIAGTVLLLGGGMWMVAESRLAADQIQDEIGQALSRLDHGGTSQ